MLFQTDMMTKPTGIKTYDLIVNVTGWLDGELADWPANIQDVILEALERKAQEEQLPLTIIHSRCDIDYGGAPDGQDQFYVHVIASEIVAADTRFYKDEHAKLKEVINQLLREKKK